MVKKDLHENAIVCKIAMETLYNQTNGLVLDTQACFQRLEKSTNDDAESLEREIQARIDSITSNCERLDLLVLKEPVVRRQTARTRVEQLRYDNQHLQAALRTLQHRRVRREKENYEREQLLSTKFTSIEDGENTTIFIDHSLNHNNALQDVACSSNNEESATAQSLERANRGVDELILSGGSVLDNLRDQRTTLKGAQRRLMDVANTLGLSNTTMRLIENRVKNDKRILFGGMFLTLLIIFGVVYYVRK